MSMKALVALEDGTIFEGESFTGAGEAFGEIVFNTRQLRHQHGRYGVGPHTAGSFSGKGI
jgi:hypothetical protein